MTNAPVSPNLKRLYNIDALVKSIARETDKIEAEREALAVDRDFWKGRALKAEAERDANATLADAMRAALVMLDPPAPAEPAPAPAEEAPKRRRRTGAHPPTSAPVKVFVDGVEHDQTGKAVGDLTTHPDYMTPAEIAVERQLADVSDGAALDKLADRIEASEAAEAQVAATPAPKVEALAPAKPKVQAVPSLGDMAAAIEKITGKRPDFAPAPTAEPIAYGDTLASFTVRGIPGGNDRRWEIVAPYPNRVLAYSRLWHSDDKGDWGSAQAYEIDDLYSAPPIVPAILAAQRDGKLPVGYIVDQDGDGAILLSLSRFLSSVLELFYTAQGLGYAKGNQSLRLAMLGRYDSFTAMYSGKGLASKLSAVIEQSDKPLNWCVRTLNLRVPDPEPEGREPIDTAPKAEAVAPVALESTPEPEGSKDFRDEAKILSSLGRSNRVCLFSILSRHEDGIKLDDWATEAKAARFGGEVAYLFNYACHAKNLGLVRLDGDKGLWSLNGTLIGVLNRANDLIPQNPGEIKGAEIIAEAAKEAKDMREQTLPRPNLPEGFPVIDNDKSVSDNGMLRMAWVDAHLLPKRKSRAPLNNAKCQICGRELQANSGIVRDHGHKRQDGWNFGACYGSGYMPAQIDTAAIKNVLTHAIPNDIEVFARKIADIESDDAVMYDDRHKGRIKLTKHNFKEVFPHGNGTFEQHKADEIAKFGRLIERAKANIPKLKEKLAEWKPEPFLHWGTPKAKA